MSKCAVIVYHKSIDSVYPRPWIEHFKYSILTQTYTKYDIYEINYGGGAERIFDKSIFYSKELPSFVNAMNFLIDLCLESEYDFIFNTNVDDWYHEQRFELQLQELRKGFDLVSSNFCLIKDGKQVLFHEFHNLILEKELTKNHNIIGHPVVAYSAGFLKRNNYKAEEIPFEDMLLWKRALSNNEKIKILPQCLLFHRLHNNSVCQSQNR